MPIDFEDSSYYDDTNTMLRKLRRDVHKTAAAVLEAQDMGLKNDEKMAEAFNRVATALEGLTAEIRGLRADLNPSLDKTRKLPAPGTGG